MPRPARGAALFTDKAKEATADAAASDMRGPVCRQGGGGHARRRGQRAARSRPPSGQGRPRPASQ